MPPFIRKVPFIKDLNNGGEFLVARPGEYGVIIHTGRIASKWASGVSGKSGGSLSAFWSPGHGSIILGRTRATQSREPDQWTDGQGRGPYTWSVHAITGKVGGNYFSTARIRDCKSHYQINDNTRATVTVFGSLADSKYADPKDALKGKVVYRRTFEIDASGVTIASTLESDGRDKISEVWEMIPIYLGDPYSHRRVPERSVEFRVHGEWQQASETIVETDAIRLARYGKSAYITFESPQSVKLSPDVKWVRSFTPHLRNVMIDLLRAGARPSSLRTASVRYRIALTKKAGSRTAQSHPLVKGKPPATPSATNVKLDKGPTADQVVAAKAAAVRLRRAVIKGVRAGRRHRVYLNLAGRTMRGRVVAADDAKLTIEASEIQIPLLWDKLPARRFYHLAAKYSDDHGLLAAYCLGHGLAELARREESK